MSYKPDCIFFYSWYSLKLPQLGDSNEYTQYVFLTSYEKKKSIFLLKDLPLFKATVFTVSI